MSVEKTIKFYSIKLNPSILYYGNNIDSHIYSIFNLAFNNGADYYQFNYDKKQLFFDIINFDKEHLFGTCSVPNDIKPTSMIQKRDNKTKEPEPFTSLNNEFNLEAYSFFYIDFTNNRMAVITNRKIPRINEILCSFINKNANPDNITELSILPERIENLSKAVENLKSKDALELEFFNRNGKNALDIKALSSTLKSEFTASKYVLTIKLEETTTSFIPSLLKWKNKVDKNSTSKIKLKGKNEFGLDETIDLFETLYTKTIPLELSDDSIKNKSYIENQLKHFLYRK